MNSYGVTIQMKPLQQYFHMVLFVLYVVLTFESVDELLWCYHSNETSSAVLSHSTVYSVCSSNFWVSGWNPLVWPFEWKLLSITCTFLWHYLLYINTQDGSTFWVYGWNPMVWLFKWKLLSNTIMRYSSLWCTRWF